MKIELNDWPTLAIDDPFILAAHIGYRLFGSISECESEWSKAEIIYEWRDECEFTNALVVLSDKDRLLAIMHVVEDDMSYSRCYWVHRFYPDARAVKIELPEKENEDEGN